MFYKQAKKVRLVPSAFSLPVSKDGFFRSKIHAAPLCERVEEGTRMPGAVLSSVL
jgi:hypothetical protein